jgi:predicted acylesterase/phospholipase RssA
VRRRPSLGLLVAARVLQALGAAMLVPIPVRVPGVGLLEFHQIDAARAAGRATALAALEDAPRWLLGRGQGSPSIAGRGTVLRV